MKYTITYKEDVKGFPSFYSFFPDWMVSMNNRLFAVKDGQLHQHHDESNPVRNNFYGVQYSSSVRFVINDAPSEIKVVKALATESNKAFDTVIKSYINDETTSVTESTISSTEYLNKEGKWHGYIRRNELADDVTSKSIYGLGEVASVSVSTITYSNSLNSLIRVGDSIYDSTNTLIGVIQSYSMITNTVVVDTTPAITPGTFTYGQKNSRIEGSDIRGYNFEVEMTDTTTTRTELFAVGSEVFKSFPS